MSYNKNLSGEKTGIFRNRLVIRGFLVIVFVLLSTSLFAQYFDGGLLAGFNGSQVRGDSYSNGFHKLGFVGGAWVQANINDNWYWGLELKYSQKGSQINPTAKNNYYLYIYRLDYIDMPVLIGYKYQNFLSFFGGVSFDYLTHRSASDSFGPIADVTGNLHDWEIALFVGLKVDFENMVNRDWARNFKFDLRYQFSAMSIYGVNGLFFYYSPYAQFNSVISTSLYYTINWRGKN